MKNVTSYALVLIYGSIFSRNRPKVKLIYKYQIICWRFKSPQKFCIGKM